MSFQQTASSAVALGSSLLPRFRLLAGAVAGGILISTFLASASSAAGKESKVSGSAASQAAHANRRASASRHAAKSANSAKSHGSATAPSSDWTACREAAAQIESRISAPKHLLSAITLTETGRKGPDGKALMAWPWTINTGGKGYVFKTKKAAIHAVRRLLAQGHRSIDVGCMQVNLKYHPRAFTSLEEAFDPLSNLAYGAAFLVRLKKQHGTWNLAVQHYHSHTVEYRREYAARFKELWAMERRRMAEADDKNSSSHHDKTASRTTIGTTFLARLTHMPRYLMGTALADLGRWSESSPVAAVMSFGVNLAALDGRALDDDRRLRRLAASYPQLADNRMPNASLRAVASLN